MLFLLLAYAAVDYISITKTMKSTDVLNPRHN